MQKDEQAKKRIMDAIIGANGKTILSTDLARIAGTEERESTNAQVRNLIKEIIEEYQVPIGSGPRGYYLIIDEQGYQRTFDYLTGVIGGTARRRKAIYKAFMAYWNPDAIIRRLKTKAGEQRSLF